MNETRAAETGPLVVLAGPTAVGKSTAALELAELFAGEIVSVDSAQVYRGLDIGTDKPTTVERSRIPHHLLDLRDPAEDYSAGNFVADARAAVTAIRARGRLPILVGGTFLYWRALFEGLGPGLPPGDPELRQRLATEAREHGWKMLHERLQRVDPQAAARIHPHDALRISRALEIHALTGKGPSAHRPRPTLDPTTALRLVVTVSDREAHRRHLRHRLEGMLARGFLEEVRVLWARGDLDLTRPALRAVGYRQLWRHCSGALGFEEAVERAWIATAQLAKRQTTWIRTLRGWESLAWEEGPLARRIQPLIEAYLDVCSRPAVRRGTEGLC